jgi:hypothetical protein
MQRLGLLLEGIDGNEKNQTLIGENLGSDAANPSNSWPSAPSATG